VSDDAGVVMITGVAGMIGSHLADALLARGHVVYGMDVVPLQDANNLRVARDNPNFRYTEGDIRDPGDLRAFFRPDATVVYHLASVVGVRRYMEDPLSLIDVAIIGTRNLISLCVEHNVRILFTSTSEVYGRNPAVPWKEVDDRVLGSTSVDRWSYSTSKALVEHMLFGVHRKFGLPMSIVRFFNVYGPRQNPIYVVSQSIHRALNGRAPDVYDGGGQTRCFTYVDDVIDGIIAAATSPAAIGEVFNLGREVPTTMAEVVSLCLRYAGAAELSPVDVRTDEKYGAVYEDIVHRVPDASKALRLLSWRATTPVDDGIRRTVEWARENPWYLE
jgi:UDP-glucose 4-epimerase